MTATATAKLMVDAEGKRLVKSWLEWQPSCKLRWTSRGLEQEWSRFGADSIGAICTTEYEWRLVPTLAPR